MTSQYSVSNRHTYRHFRPWDHVWESLPRRYTARKLRLPPVQLRWSAHNTERDEQTYRQTLQITFERTSLLRYTGSTRTTAVVGSITTSSERDLETLSKNARTSLRGRRDKVSRIVDRHIRRHVIPHGSLCTENRPESVVSCAKSSRTELDAKIPYQNYGTRVR